MCYQNKLVEYNKISFPRNVTGYLFYLASLSTAKDQPHTDRASAFRLSQTI